MTEERAMKIAEALTADAEAAERLLKLSPEEAAAELGKMGCGVTAEELCQFRDELVKGGVNAEGELDAETLSAVAGGSSSFWNGVRAGFKIASIAVALSAPW